MQHLTVLTSKRNSLFDSKGRFHWTMNEPAWNSIICLDSESWTPEQWWHLPNSGKPYQPDIIVRLDLTKLSDPFHQTNHSSSHWKPRPVLARKRKSIILNTSRRGDVELFLRSPMGTRSMILSTRPNDDDSRDGFTKWPFMTTHTWAEYPRGKWTLEVRFNGLRVNKGFLKEWTLMLHGTRDAPYSELPVTDPHSKLAIVKKAHEDKKKM